MNNLPEAGIGMIYLPGLENLVESHLHYIDVIEIEPQTLWYNKNAKCDSFHFNRDLTSQIQSYDCNKLFHSVGSPIGGTVFPRVEDLALLNAHAAVVDPLWISEHLSFNTIHENGVNTNTNFLLPPLQTKAGITTAVNAIQHFRSAIKLPFAFETGVNYLKPQKDEYPDGYFVGQIAEEADCYILLDLHNIMANQLNGRQTVADYVNQLPLERVCEIHLAGGFFHKDYYLDAHSGISTSELFDIADNVISKLPNLKAIIFEMLPNYVANVSVDDMRFQFEKMRRLWDHRGKEYFRKKKLEPIPPGENTPKYSSAEWEYTLGKVAIEQGILGNQLALTLAQDNGLKIINELIFHFRASMVVTTLKLTTRLLRHYIGHDNFNSDLKRFFRSSAPEAFAYAVAKKYAQYVLDKKYEFPYLYKTMEYELAALNTLSDNEPRSVAFDFNPFPVFRSLTEGQLPGEQDTPMSFILSIQPGDIAIGSDALNYLSVFHN